MTITTKRIEGRGTEAKHSTRVPMPYFIVFLIDFSVLVLTYVGIVWLKNGGKDYGERVH